jgi:hypothetical protein
MRRCLTLALLAACTNRADVDPTDPDTLDLTAPVPAGEARAAAINDEAALFGGVAADAQLGDLMLVNDRVRYVVQGARRDGSYFVSTGGGVIDADLVRAPGEPGRDLLDEWVPMYGAARVLEPTKVEVINDGRDGGPAIVRATGFEAPMTLIEGTLESPGFLPPLSLEVVTTYTLQPDAWLLEVHSEVISRAAEPQPLDLGDILMGSADAAWPWHQGTGLQAQDQPSFGWSGFIGQRHDVAVATLAAPGRELVRGALQVIESAADMTVAFGPKQDIAPGATLTWDRLYGVGPDFATLSDEALTRAGTATATETGTVLADDGPVAGAWVVVLVDERPYTVAVTGADGTFSALVPAGSTHRALAIGRATGRFADVHPSAAPYPAYGTTDAQQLAIQSMLTGAAVSPPAEGRGIATPDDPLRLGVPATAEITVADGLPFFAELIRRDADAPYDNRLAPERPRGNRGATGWSRDGTLTLLAEPGNYELIVRRGLRFEVDRQEVTLTAGTTTPLSATLPQATTLPGYLLGDPHAHASPSADASITMEDRLLVAAGNGVQVHFGTDHDHAADYRPLLTGLGLAPALASVVADEVSPPARGHMNIYPIEPKPGLPNNGVWRWWEDIPTTTEGVVDSLIATHGTEFILQSNHPLDSGVASSAGWRTGLIRRADKWTDRLAAIEVMNSGDYADYLTVYLDLINRGYLITPVGVSDSHGHFAGHVGSSATYLGVGVDDPSALTNEALVEAMRARRTIVTNGPTLAVSVPPGSVSGPTDLQVTATCPSWCTVDRLLLLRDGVEVERVDGTTHTFSLRPDVDASYLVIAEGDASMQPVDDRTPWAMTSAILIDLATDGWDPPLPPLVLE